MEYKNVAFALMAISALTSLITQAIKVIFAENHVEVKKPNTLAGIISIILSIVLGIGYVYFTGVVWSVQIVLTIVALAVLSWLCAMLGYDKVIQTINQFKQ